MLKRFFQEFENFVFDLDGTTWRWTELSEDFYRVYQALVREGKNIYFISDNTLLTREGLLKKLHNFGIEAKLENLVTPSLIAKDVLLGKRVFCIGEGLITDLRKHGIKVSSSKPDAVVVGMDRTLTYEKLCKAVEFVVEGTGLFKTSKSPVFINGRKLYPGVGAIAKLLEMVCNKKAELLGAPSKFMINFISTELNLDPKKTVLFGDECDTDMALGNMLGFTTVLVISRKEKEIEYLKARGINEPKIVIKSLKQILR